MIHRSLTDKRAEEERIWWVNLTEIAKTDNTALFMQKYAEYLKWNNIISPSRQVLYNMICKAAKELKNE
jgi:hypothetical protein